MIQERIFIDFVEEIIIDKITRNDQFQGIFRSSVIWELYEGYCVEKGSKKIGRNIFHAVMKDLPFLEKSRKRAGHYYIFDDNAYSSFEWKDQSLKIQKRITPKKKKRRPVISDYNVWKEKVDIMMDYFEAKIRENSGPLELEAIKKLVELEKILDDGE